MPGNLRFDAALWEWTGPGASWFFVTLPEGLSDDIDEAQTGRRAGFGSVKVRVTIGKTTWDTSLFPSRDAGAFILPIKKSVRSAEGLDEGSTACIALCTLT